MKKSEIEKEIERIKSKPIKSHQRLDYISSDIEKRIKHGKARFERLKEAIDKQFPAGTNQRGAADGIIAFSLENAIESFFIGNNSAVIMEIHSSLERACLDEITRYLSISQEAEEILKLAFNRKTLTDLSDYFLKTGHWSKEDVDFAKKLTNIRNSIAHKNFHNLNKQLSDGKEKFASSIHDITNKTNCIPFIIQTISLLIKISKLDTPSIGKNPRFASRVEAYSAVLGGVFNLFLYPNFVNLQKEFKFLILNDKFSKVSLLGSQSLIDLVSEYKSLVLEFHDVLGIDDKKANEMHSHLGKLCEKIFLTMRTDIQIDNPTSDFIKPTYIRYEKIIDTIKEMYNSN